jgi:hypothetical protein
VEPPPAVEPTPTWTVVPGAQGSVEGGDVPAAAGSEILPPEAALTTTLPLTETVPVTQ